MTAIGGERWRRERENKGAECVHISLLLRRCTPMRACRIRPDSAVLLTEHAALRLHAVR